MIVVKLIGHMEAGEEELIYQCMEEDCLDIIHLEALDIEWE